MYKASFTYNSKNYTFTTNFNDHIFNVLTKYKTFYEIKLLKKIQSLRLKGAVLDVGANIGNHTVFFSKECRFDSVISFEMNRDLFQILLNNTEVNDCHNVICQNFAVADKIGLVGSSVLDLKNTGSTHVIPDGDIKQVTLDSLIDSPVSLIKMDIEGYELKALQGSQKLLSSYHPVIVCECQKSFREVDGFLRKFGYSTDHTDYAATPTFIWTAK
jgi:protein O-GlcNAc transferase